MNLRVLGAVLVLALSLASSAQSITSASTSGESEQASPPSQQSSATQPQSGEIVGGRLVRKEDPKYPKEARKQKMQGEVLVQVIVEENGAVSRAAALRGELPLAKSAVNAVVKWRFQPFTRNGNPLRVQQNLVFNFALANNVGELELPLPAPTVLSVRIPISKSPPPGIGGVYRVGGGVSAPRVLYSPDPEYSDEARKAKYQGVCVLTLIVGPDGLPRDIRVARSLGMGLDEKAIEAVKQWKFDPAKKDGQPVPVAINVEVDFRL